MNRKRIIAHTRDFRRVKLSAELIAELSKPQRTVGLSHFSVKDFLATLPILNRKELSFSNAATGTIARSIIVKGCLAYMLYFHDATPNMRDLTLVKEYPLISFIHRQGRDPITSISMFTGDSALCQLLAELLSRWPTSLFELPDWDRSQIKIPENCYDPGRIPLEWDKIQHPLTIAGELGWTHAAKGVLRASINGNHPELVPIVRLSKSEQTKILGTAANCPSSWDQVFDYTLENLVRMPDNCCDVKVSYQITQLQKVKKAVADSLLDNGPDEAAVRQYIYSEAAGRLMWMHSRGASLLLRLSVESLKLVCRTLSERYGKTTTDADNEHHITSRGLPSSGSISQEKARSQNVVQGPSKIHGSLLHAAPFHGRFAMIEALLDDGADVSLRVEPHLTALHAAALAPQCNCLLLLLDRGADIHAIFARKR